MIVAGVLLAMFIGQRYLIGSGSGSEKTSEEFSDAKIQAIASCMQFNQNKHDAYFAKIFTNLENSMASVNNSLSQAAGVRSYESTNQKKDCGSFCSRPDEYRYECTQDPTFIWAPPK